MKPTKVAMIVPSITSGGIGPVCSYSAQELSKLEQWEVSLVALHDPSGFTQDEQSQLNIFSLGLNDDCSESFLSWLEHHPQGVLITNNVSLIEGTFPFLPADTIHIFQIHDSMRRYRASAIDNNQHIDAVTCVGQHILPKLKSELAKAGFNGITQCIHNGAIFPPEIERQIHSDPLKLLFVGRMDPLKGIFDLPKILRKLESMNVPVELHIVGGSHEKLARKLSMCSSKVFWHGTVSHSECYRIAATTDIFLMLSRQEAFGMVTIEAMSMGCVPIAYDMPSGNVEIIQRPEHGYLIPLGSIQGCAEAVYNLHNNRELLWEKSKSCSKRVRNDFTAKKTAASLSDLIQTAIERRSRIKPQRLKRQKVNRTTADHKLGMFHQLPASWRAQIRELVCSFPRLAHWVFKRL